MMMNEIWKFQGEKAFSEWKFKGKMFSILKFCESFNGVFGGVWKGRKISSHWEKFLEMFTLDNIFTKDDDKRKSYFDLIAFRQEEEIEFGKNTWNFRKFISISAYEGTYFVNVLCVELMPFSMSFNFHFLKIPNVVSRNIELDICKIFSHFFW